MKKIVSLLLALMLALSLAACSAKSASNDSASMASDSYDFNGAEMPDMEYGYTASDDGAWDGQSVSSPARICRARRQDGLHREHRVADAGI